MSRATRRKKVHSESGMTLIELAIAAVVLIVGMLSIMGVLLMAVGNNGRSKIDSTATMLSQAVLEQLSAKLSGGGPGSLTDNSNCNGTGTTWQIAWDPTPGGANVSGSGIDFSQSQSTIANDGNGYSYYMNYVDCNNNIQMTYDVRWNVQALGAATYLVTVGARPKGNLPTQYSFSIPVNMRTYVGGQ